MPSLFSRARTTSSPLKVPRQSTDILDEFGRVPSRVNDTFPGKKGKNVEQTRTRTLSAAKGRAPGPLPDEDPVIADGSFSPSTSIPQVTQQVIQIQNEVRTIFLYHLFFSRRRCTGAFTCRSL